VVGIINDTTYQGSAINTLTIQTSAAYDAWKTEWFTEAEQADPALSGPEAYYDSDDYSNYEEFIAGTDPTDGQSAPYFYIQPKEADPGEYDYILDWSSAPERIYSVNWSPNLLQPFTPLQTNIRWPQSSYTDQTHRVETKGFYRMKVNIPTVTATATFIGSSQAAVEGVNGDAFDGATVTAHSSLHPVSTTTDDWFSAPNATELLFDDPPGTKFVEFNTASVVSLTNITVYLSGDYNGSGPEGRSISDMTFYASTTPSGWDATALVFDIVVDPDYSAAYGSQYVEVSVDLTFVAGQYFRMEFNQPLGGARIREVDAFSK
ncbi:MAG: hypothetical protein DRP64_04020, partial [Verrucomicrobia bacterium]